MKFIATVFLAAAGLALARPAPPPNTPSPMLPAASTNCEGFFLASPGVSCWSMATEHGLSVDDFVRINPQVPPAGGCEGGGIVPHHWYCIKGLAGSHKHVNISTPSDAKPPATPAKATFTKSDTPTPKPEPPPVPKPTPPPELRCEVDNCYRGFLRVVPRVRETYRSFCAELLERPCLAATMEELDAPTIISNECQQTQPCETVSSACACYLAGRMD